MTVIDTTEAIEPQPATSFDPEDQTGSDDETEPIHPLRKLPYIPIRDRWDKWRMWWEGGEWHVRQPLEIDPPFFKIQMDDKFSYAAWGYVHHSGARALSELQLAIAKAEAR